ncbi:MAG: hypothetical protein PHD81_02820 [Candidatus Nanoarchaeia archaeon]|nr:hypothetical protein [Candidatus Nanoarchaeia archaeon]MDD5588017.1 hypothetical protein [Candidatus Nanoarchaeia archaeon]
MFSRSKNRVKKFGELTKEIDKLIDKARYEDAIFYYAKANEVFDAIPASLKTNELRQILEDINRELILYMKVKELHILVSENKLARVPELIEDIEMVIKYINENIPNKQNLIDFATEQLDYLRKKSDELHENLQFNSRHINFHILIKRKDFTKARAEINKLEDLYRKVSFHRKKIFLFNKLQRLKDELRLAEGKEANKAQVKHYLFEKHSTEFIKPEYKEVLKLKAKIKKTVIVEQTPEEICNRIHKLLKKNNLKDAQKLMESV